MNPIKSVKALPQGSNQDCALNITHIFTTASFVINIQGLLSIKSIAKTLSYEDRTGFDLLHRHSLLTTTVPAMKRFQDLPPEIRNHIYEYALTFSGPLQIRHRHIYDINMNDRALMQTCQLQRTEALGIYYGSNTFVLSSLRYLGDWLLMLGSNVKHLDDLVLTDGVLEGYSTPAFALAGTMRVQVKLALAGGQVVVSGVDGHVDDTMLEAAKKYLGPAAKWLGRKNEGHVLTVKGTLAHCFHCLEGTCQTCKNMKDCCKRV